MSSPSSFRLSDQALRLVVLISEALGLKRSAVLELAIRELARRNKIKDEVNADAKESSDQ